MEKEEVMMKVYTLVVGVGGIRANGVCVFVCSPVAVFDGGGRGERERWRKGKRQKRYGLPCISPRIAQQYAWGETGRGDICR